MLILSGADVVLPGGPAGPSTVLVEEDRIVDIRPGIYRGTPADRHLDLRNHLIVPGFVDVHVHGIEGRDVLDEGRPLGEVASRLPRYGVTSFCPTSVACGTDELVRLFDQVRELRAAPPRNAARVVGAHLESNFISPDYRGAQPLEMLRTPANGAGILERIADGQSAIAIVTVAPEIDGGLDLVGRLAAAGHRVSLGHSGASFDVGRAALDAGASHGTHLFNRMPPLGHRQPGLAGALIADERAAVEVICDGFHVHPTMVRMVVRSKGAERVMAITDGTAGSGLPDGSRTRLGARDIVVRKTACYLADGTLAGSALTFDAAFRVLVEQVGLTLAEAVRLSATTPARELGLADRGVLAPGLLADLTVFDADLRLTHTVVAGSLAYAG